MHGFRACFRPTWGKEITHVKKIIIELGDLFDVSCLSTGRDLRVHFWQWGMFIQCIRNWNTIGEVYIFSPTN